MNWMRWQVPPIERAIALASDVLPTPGTSSMRRWPSASRQTSARWICSRLPWMTCSTLSSERGEQAAERRVAARRGGGLNHEHLQSVRPDGTRGVRYGAGATASRPASRARTRRRPRRAARRSGRAALRSSSPGPSLWPTALRQARRLARPAVVAPPAVPARPRPRLPRGSASRPSTARPRPGPTRATSSTLPRVVPGDGRRSRRPSREHR